MEGDGVGRARIGVDQADHVEVVRQLLEAGGNPDIRNNKREQAVTLARRTGNAELVALIEGYRGKRKGLFGLF